LLPYLNVDVIAGAVNSNGAFLQGLVGNLNTTVLANAMNANPSLTSDLIAKLDPSVISGVVNNNGPFLADLMNRMNPEITARAVNANGALLTQLLAPGGIEPATLGYVINNNPTFVKGMISYLDAHASAVPMNNSDLTVRLMRYDPASGTFPLSPAVVANLLNTHGEFVANLLGANGGGLAPTIANAVNVNGAWLTAMMNETTAIGGNADIVDVINNNPGAQALINSLLQPGMLSPSILAGAMAANPGMTIAMLAAPPVGINPAPLMQILDDPRITAFVGSLMGHMDAGGTKDMVKELVNPNGGHAGQYHMISNLLKNIQPQVIANAIAGPAGAENTNVLRRMEMYGITVIQLSGMNLSNMEGWTQFVDAHVSSGVSTWAPY
jgi:hypothetical protein